VPLVVALIATLPSEPGCFYLAVGAAVAAAGGLRGWGPRSSVQTSSGCEHNSQGRAFEKQGDAARPPWGTSNVHLPKKPVRVMATCGPVPSIAAERGAEGLGCGKWKGKRRQQGEGPRGSWDAAPRVSASGSWVAHELLGPALFWPSLICIWSAAHSPSLCSFSAPPGRHFRPFLQSDLCAVFQALFLNHELLQLGSVGTFPFQTWQSES